MVAEGPSRTAGHPAFRRLPFLALAAISLFAGLWGGLLRLGVGLPIPTATIISEHGGFMVGGFLGTLIGVERAVALGKWWAYAAPALTGGGCLAALLGAPPDPCLIAVALGSIVFLGASVVVTVRQPASFTLAMALGALAWVVGNALWWMGWPIFDLVLWWVAFLLFTIAGERLELSRIRPPRPGAIGVLAGLGVLFGIGLVAAHWVPATGGRLVGGSMLGFALWFGRCDLARHTVRQTGLPRYVAVCLLSGFAWLGLSGTLLLVLGWPVPGLHYDAVLHAFFVGFVFSMIFGHAPIIFPAVLRIRISYHPVLYVALVVLHSSLVLRLLGDLGGPPARQWGGGLSALAIVLFAATLAGTTLRARSVGTSVQPSRSSEQRSADPVDTP